MDVSKAEKARLGFFLLVTMGLLAAIVFAMIGKRIFTEKVPYYTRLSESVSGLELGTPVKQNGVEVGNITRILTDSSDVTKSIVVFDVAKGTPMKKDMVATMGTYGITGLKYLEITGGSYSSADIPPGGEMNSELSTLGKFAERADSIAYKVDKLLGNIVTFTEMQNREHIDRLLKSSANLTASLDTLVQDLGRIRPGRRLDNILTQMEATAKELRSQVQNAELDKTVQEYRKAAEGITGVAQKVDITVLRVQEDLSQSMINMRETMKNMNTFSRQIKDNPSVLLRGEDKQERRR